MTRARHDGRIPVLYLAPWVDFGGTDKGTIDWFRWLDRDRYAPSLITTQPSENRRLGEVLPFAEEVWALPELMAGGDMPWFIFDFIHSRGIEVLHVMNSRLGFDLLPDLDCIPRPPKVVVQLHVEEESKAGYVRYVTTRYGNLVDGFSVTSEDLARRVYDYGVSRGRIHVIYTGVDADEFSPDRVSAVEGLPSDRVHILHPGRLVEQKDPLLMVDVVAEARDRLDPFQVHAVGEGPLEGKVTERLVERGLEEHVIIHPPTNRLHPWYAACDVLLMTSLFEGVPYVAYEAMAMGIPVVAPALPGNLEVLGELTDGLVEPRHDVEGYVRALAPLVESSARREELGRRGREHVRENFSVRRMADEHVRLYERLIGPRDRMPVPEANGRPPGPLRFRGRKLHEEPLVSVIVPCFNHGRFLTECLDSVRAQTYPALELIVVDDGSTDPATVTVLDELEKAGDATMIRMPEKGGPGRARNAALECCAGRYVLPVDADNILLPDAVERLVEQLKVSGEEVGFIYPSLQYFGNRDDVFEAPDWNLHTLLGRNFCDVCSLFDRDVFDAGERFDESTHFRHEDWEFVLQLAARGIRGEPARAPTVLYRKHGFNRSDRVEYAATSPRDAIARSPLHSFQAEIKSRWSPALSIVALEQVDAAGESGLRLGRRLAAQTCPDVELIVRYDGEWHASRPVPSVVRIPPALAESAGNAIADGWRSARGSMVAITSGTGSSLLADPGFVEKLLRVFQAADTAGRSLGALVLADTADDGAVPLQPVDGDAASPPPHTIVVTAETEERLERPLIVDRDGPMRSLLEAAVPAAARVQWRHWPAPGPPAPCGDDVVVRGRAGKPRHGVKELVESPALPSLLPAMPARSVPRWDEFGEWTPPQSAKLHRYRQQDGESRLVSGGPPPPGYVLEHELGFVRMQALEGTAHLMATEDGDYVTVPRGEPGRLPREGRDLGFVELTPLPLLQPLILARHRPTGQRVLVSGPDDPLLHAVEPVESLGFVEPPRASPRIPALGRNAVGLVGLTRSVDRGARRHRCAAGRAAEGELLGELGALLETRPPNGVPLWIEDGRGFTPEHGAATRPPRVTAAARWSLAPLGWPGDFTRLSRVRAIVGRTGSATVRLAGRRRYRPSQPEGRPAGWLESEPLDGTAPLWASYHPVTGDQMLSRSVYEANALGYRSHVLLGHLRAEAPLTGSLEQRHVAVPWASRFGLGVARA